MTRPTACGCSSQVARLVGRCGSCCPLVAQVDVGPKSRMADYFSIDCNGAARLAASERRLQLALSSSRGIGTWDWDVALDQVVTDERFAHLYGVDPERARAGAPIAGFFTAIHPMISRRSAREKRKVANGCALLECRVSFRRRLWAECAGSSQSAAANRTPMASHCGFRAVSCDIPSARFSNGTARPQRRVRVQGDRPFAHFCPDMAALPAALETVGMTI